MDKKSLAEAVQEDVTELTCLECGEPLEILHHEGQWILGHFRESCGSMIKHPDIHKALEKYNVMKNDKSTIVENNKTGFLCLHCGHELHDSNGIVLHKFNTKVKHVFCPNCEWKGYRRLDETEKE